MIQRGSEKNLKEGFMLLQINPQNPQIRLIRRVVDALEDGGVIAYPTDTVYGLICMAEDKKAVEKIFTIKKRNKKNYLPLFVKDIKMAKKIAVIDIDQEKLLKKYWPGKTTVVLKRQGGKNIYGVDKNTIALRIPKYDFLNILLNKLKFPLVQTSANISGMPSITNAKEAIKQFSKKKIEPDSMIDAGILNGKSSKIIDFTINPPKILRY